MTPFLAVLTTVISASFLMGACDDPPDQHCTPTTVATVISESTSVPSATATEALLTRRVTLAAVGDLMLGRSVGERVVAEGPELVFNDPIASVLRSADLTIGNLETPVSERGEPERKGYTFRSPPLTTAALALAGFDVVALANNHSLDYGPIALADTALFLRAAGIVGVGAGPNRAVAQAPVIIEPNGLRIAIVGLVNTASEGDYNREAWEAQLDRPGVAWADQSTIKEAIIAAKEAADVVVVLLHFGVEFSGTPSEDQRLLAHSAIDAGAALVVGSHPHVLQQLETYSGGLIAYSLGNFVFDGFDGAANISTILQVTLTSHGIESWHLTQIEVGSDGLPRLAAP